MILVANKEGWPGVACTSQALAAGARAIDAIEAGIRLVEADERVRTAGRGGWPNILGEVELDAAIMDGDTRRTGAGGGAQGLCASDLRRACGAGSAPRTSCSPVTAPHGSPGTSERSTGTT